MILHKKEDTLNRSCYIMKVTKQTLQHLRKKVPFANTLHGTLYLCYRHWTISIFPGRTSTDSQYHSAEKVSISVSMYKIQSFRIKDCDFPAGEFDESFALKVSKHSSDNFPVGTKMISNRLMSDFQLVCSFDRDFF